jgi:hypothetical protein
MTPYNYRGTTAKTLLEISENLYVAGPIQQTTNLVLSGEVTTTIYDENGDEVEETTKRVNAMFEKPKCSLSQVARSALPDLFLYGPSIYNQVWTRDKGELVCTELVRLHPYTFSAAPATMGGSNLVYGRILKGIVYNTLDRTTHYYQTQTTGTPVELPFDSLFVIKDPSDNYPDGESVIYPIAPIIGFLDYAWNTLGQQMFRTGAPLMFIKIENPQPEKVINGVTIESDVEYAQKILANWGKDTGYTLRSNFTLEKVEVKEGSLAITSIKMGAETITNYLNPTGMIGKDGTLIGSDSKAQLTLLNNYILGLIKMLEGQLNALPTYYLNHNGYPDTYYSKVSIRHTVLEDENANLQKATLGATNRSLSINECRKLLGFEPLNDDDLTKINSDWDKIAVPQAAASPFSFTDQNSPTVSAYRVRNRIANEAIVGMEEATDDFEHEVRGLLRKYAAETKK